MPFPMRGSCASGAARGRISLAEGWQARAVRDRVRASAGSGSDPLRLHLLGAALGGTLVEDGRGAARVMTGAAAVICSGESSARSRPTPRNFTIRPGGTCTT